MQSSVSALIAVRVSRTHMDLARRSQGGSAVTLRRRRPGNFEHAVRALASATSASIDVMVPFRGLRTRSTRPLACTVTERTPARAFSVKASSSSTTLLKGGSNKMSTV